MNSQTVSATILIVDDEDMIRESLRDILEDEHYTVHTAASASEARAQFQALQPDLILLDIWMPDADGISLLREWQQEKRLQGPVVMMSGHGTIETAVEATRLGAYDFLEKPLSTAKLLLTIERALQTWNLQTQNAALKAQINPVADLIGKSQPMQRLREQADRLAQQQVPLLIHGNAGTGKQHLGKYIHQHSPRADAPFVAANLTGMDSADIYPALIGSDKRKGLIARADGGTLYLDEITALREDSAQLLITLLEHGHYTSAEGQRQADIRLIAATRLPLDLLKERLPGELYDQLTVARIDIPPLAQHSEDVPELLDYFSQYFADHEQLPYRHFTLAAQNALRQHSWPGNIRELKNLVQRLLISSEAAEIDAHEASLALSPASNHRDDGLWSQIIPKDLSLREAREVFERQYLLEQFRHCDGNVAQLAQRVGMDRTNLYRKLRSLGIDPTQKPD